jgi:hypothetical protein
MPNLPLNNQMKKKMHKTSETASMQILSNCEDINLVEDLLPVDEDLEQFFFTL